MGKEYSSDAYKKSYSGDYVRSYQDSNIQKKLNEDKRKEYDTISKKLNDRPYTKSEKESYKGLSSTPSESNDRVKAEGERRTGRTPRPLTQQAKQVQPTSRSNNTVNKAPIKEKVETPPPYIPKVQQSEDNDYSYIDPDSSVAPVMHLPDGKYRNIHTKKIVTENEARRLLKKAGYSPKKNLNPVLFVLICIVTFPLKIVGPVVLIIWGISKQRTANTVFEKRVDAIKYAFHMPATSEEISEQSKTGMRYFAAGVVILLLQLYFL